LTASPRYDPNLDADPPPSRGYAPRRLPVAEPRSTLSTVSSSLVIGLLGALAGYFLSEYSDTDGIAVHRPREVAERNPASSVATAQPSEPGVHSAARPSPDPVRADAPPSGAPSKPAADPRDSRANRATQTEAVREKALGSKANASQAGPVTNNAENPTAEDISGWWTLINRIESASYKAFENLTLGFRLMLEQRGTSVVGTGYKTTESRTAMKSPCAAGHQSLSRAALKTTALC
jgi:hypothetical protein